MKNTTNIGSKMFDFSSPLPTFVGKHARGHEIAMLLLAFVIVPVTSVLLVVLSCKDAGLNVTQTTISMLAWIYDKLPEVYVWGGLNIGLLIYLFAFNVESHRYAKWAKAIFYSLLAICALLLIVGVSIPFNERYPNYQQLHKIHNVMTVTGFALAVVVWLLFVVTLYFRNTKQAIIMTAFSAFFIISAAFALPLVKHPDIPAALSCVTQLYVFGLLHVMLSINYCFSKMLGNKHEPAAEA